MEVLTGRTPRLQVCGGYAILRAYGRKKMKNRSDKKECQELMRQIRARKAYRYDLWCAENLKPSPLPGWDYIVLAGGDRREQLSPGFLAVHGKRTSVVELDGAPHTVLRVRTGLAESLRRARNLRTFWYCLSRIVPERDLKQYHYDLWLHSHNLEANVSRLRELTEGGGKGEDGTSREVAAEFAAPRREMSRRSL